MLDKFKSMQELEKETIENEDWKIITRNRNSSVSILAIHGGGIEPATTELASIIAMKEDIITLFSKVYVVKEIKNCT